MAIEIERGRAELVDHLDRSFRRHLDRAVTASRKIALYVSGMAPCASARRVCRCPAPFWRRPRPRSCRRRSLSAVRGVAGADPPPPQDECISDRCNYIAYRCNTPAALEGRRGHSPAPRWPTDGSIDAGGASSGSLRPSGAAARGDGGAS
jgi:hypothetical protein